MPSRWSTPKNYSIVGAAMFSAFALSACCEDEVATQVVPAPPAGQDGASPESAPPSGESGVPATPAPQAVLYPDLSGSLIGAGSSAQAAGMQAWQAGFQAAAPGVTVEYDPVGSGGGREAFLDGGVAFAGSDAALDEEELELSKQRCAGDQGAVDLPHYISPIAVPYNLPSLAGATLNLTPEVMAGIFANEITRWDDPAIAEANPDLALPALAINPVHRSDDSGTTKNFTDYLSQAAPDVWTWGKLETWDTEGPGGGEGAAQTSGVVAAVQAGEGSIGYADASQIGDLPAAAVGVADGFVEYSPEAAARVVDNSEPVPGRNPLDLAIEVDRTPSTSDTYPIALVSYHIVCLEYPTTAEAELVKSFMNYVGSEQGQQAAALGAGSAPISDELRATLAATVDAITGSDDTGVEG